MGNIKRTFSIPNEVSEELDEAVPSQKRSKFIVAVLKEALQKQRRSELLDLLERLPRLKEQDGIRSEDVLRKIRDERAQEILSNNHS